MCKEYNIMTEEFIFEVLMYTFLLQCTHPCWWDTALEIKNKMAEVNRMSLPVSKKLQLDGSCKELQL